MFSLQEVNFVTSFMGDLNSNGVMCFLGILHLVSQPSFTQATYIINIQEQNYIPRWRLHGRGISHSSQLNQSLWAQPDVLLIASWQNKHLALESQRIAMMAS
jgi:hypothetical protein